MRKWLACLAFVAAIVPGAAAADVAPLSPEGRIIMQKREAFEANARNALHDIGLIERLRDWRKYQGFVIVGKQNSTRAPRVLVKDEYGWYEMRPGEARRITGDVGHELTRLLTSAQAWNGESYNFGERCSEPARLFIVAYAGRDQFGRIGCGKEGLPARTARVSEALRAPVIKRFQVLPAVEREPVGGVPLSQQRNNEDLFERVSNMVSAWEGRRLAGYVDPYADDVIVERAEGTIRGRKALVDWVRHEQNWDELYPQQLSRRVLHQMSIAAQPSNKLLYTTHEIRWDEGGALKRQTFSTMWRNDAGMWQIAYERVSPVRPVTDGRPL